MRGYDWRRAASVAGFFTLVLILAAAALAFDVRLASSQNVQLVANRTDARVSLEDPYASIWGRAAPVTVPLSAQRTTLPFGGGSVPALTARAMHDDQRLYILVEWKDETEDSSVADQEAFRDAVAVEFPMVAGDKVPFFCMGQADGHVNIWHWKGDWQAVVDSGRSPLAPSAYTDDYALQDDVVFQDPADAAGSVYAARERVTPVENLLAGGFGTLTSADQQPVDGVGRWRDGRWRVLFARDLAGDGETGIDLSSVTSTSAAFAVWDGAKGDRNGQKSVSTFVGLELSSSPLGAAPSGVWQGVVIVIIVVAVFGGMAALLSVLYLRRRLGKAR
jgi:hypothetical protein